MVGKPAVGVKATPVDHEESYRGRSLSAFLHRRRLHSIIRILLHVIRALACLLVCTGCLHHEKEKEAAMKISERFYECLESRDWPCVASLVNDEDVLARIDANARTLGPVQSVNYEGAFSLTDRTVSPQIWRVTFRTVVFYEKVRRKEVLLLSRVGQQPYKVESFESTAFP